MTTRKDLQNLFFDIMYDVTIKKFEKGNTINKTTSEIYALLFAVINDVLSKDDLTSLLVELKYKAIDYGLYKDKTINLRKILQKNDNE